MSPGADPPEMVVHIRLFAILRERAGRDSVELHLSDGATVADALRALSELPPLGELLGRLPVQMAVNRDYATAETTLAPGDELALIPPVSGGGGEPAGGGESREPLHVRVSEQPLSIERLSRAVADSRAGAIVVFEGMTRQVPRLDYEAYVGMAEQRIEQIMRDCISAHGLCAAAVEHRVGGVALGEPSVIVAVSAPHRAEAFAGASAAIDRIKAEAPIWKREQVADGEGTWVG
ncbi:MAG: molybdopterin converting factor, subunit 1 [Solirubrobacterales bacterium]|jgi:molybdopterin converting factor subunit 1|nr:molybdopterin converting factor, subunit 1 [Solirubrobacterales bacterium]